MIFTKDEEKKLLEWGEIIKRVVGGTQSLTPAMTLNFLASMSMTIIDRVDKGNERIEWTEDFLRDRYEECILRNMEKLL